MFPSSHSLKQEGMRIDEFWELSFHGNRNFQGHLTKKEQKEEIIASFSRNVLIIFLAQLPIYILDHLQDPKRFRKIKNKIQIYAYSIY